ncbi:hypothetical protein QQ054_16145 [Oscillatoria amoena NRMC-F 0135]|nr:hypothetical protein [Oscillatoria amoena NRMC-F 0135]
MITLTRHCSYADAIRKYRVIIDGHEFGCLKQGETWSYEGLTQGSHTIWLKIDWCRSNQIEFEYSGEDILFECGSNLAGLKVILTILYFFMPTKWCWIKQIETEQVSSSNSLQPTASTLG